MEKIVIDTDPGCDDAMAIAFALAHPDLDLIALTTVFGNVRVSQATRNALDLLDAYGAAHVPVYQGAAVPLIKPPGPYPTFVHGENGLGEIQLPQSKRSAGNVSAAEYIVRQANKEPGGISVVMIGPLTNLALALRLDPDLPEKLKGLVIMGGTMNESGNVSPVAEANFLADPHAADIVLGQRWPVVIVGLDVTHHVLLAETDIRKLLDFAGEAGRIIWESSQFYMDFYSTTPFFTDKSERGCCMHDASALAYLVAKERFQLCRGAARVVTEGVAAGQLTLAREGFNYPLPHWQNRPPVNYCLSANAASVKQVFIDSLIRSFGNNKGNDAE